MSNIRSKPIIYGIKRSPTVNAVLLLLKELHVDYEFRKVNPRSSDYLTINPTQSVPTLEHNGRYICDSHAINAYLVGIYGKPDDPLYPKDLHKRALVDHCLHFENGELFTNCVHQISVPLFRGEWTDVPKDKIQAIAAAYDSLERFFGENKFVAGPNMTIADFSCFCSVGVMSFFRPLDEKKHPKLVAWLERMRALPYFSEIVESDNSINVAGNENEAIAKL